MAIRRVRGKGQTPNAKVRHANERAISKGGSVNFMSGLGDGGGKKEVKWPTFQWDCGCGQSFSDRDSGRVTRSAEAHALSHRYRG